MGLNLGYGDGQAGPRMASVHGSGVWRGGGACGFGVSYYLDGGVWIGEVGPEQLFHTPHHIILFHQHAMHHAPCMAQLAQPKKIPCTDAMHGAACPSPYPKFRPTHPVPQMTTSYCCYFLHLRTVYKMPTLPIPP